jgi:hypothetical protein
MNKVKFTLADVIGLVAVLAFGFTCFLGSYLSNLGNMSFCIVEAGIISAVLWGLSFTLKQLKKTKRRFLACKIWEGVVLVLFMGVAFITFFAFSSWFAIAKHKTEIVSKTVENVDQIKNMFSAYDTYAQARVKSYKEQLQTVIRGKNANEKSYEKMGFKKASGDSDEVQRDRFVKVLESNLRPAEYDVLKTNALEWLEQSRQKIDVWRPLALVNIVGTLEKQANEWESRLKEFSAGMQMEEKAEPFGYAFSFDEVTAYFTEIALADCFSFQAIVLALLAYACMLLSWIITLKHLTNNIPWWRLLWWKLPKINDDPGEVVL